MYKSISLTGSITDHDLSTIQFPKLKTSTLSLQAALMTFANSLDTVQDRQNVGPASGSKLFATLIVFLKEFCEKVYFEKSKHMTTKA